MNLERAAAGSYAGCAGVAAKATPFSRGEASSAKAWIDTIQMYRFPLGMAVVAVHSGEFALSLGGVESGRGGMGNIWVWLVEFLTMTARLATPAFLVIAGFVFFRDGKVSLDGYRRKVKSRLYTLLVPYVAWNFIAILLLCAPAAYKHFFLAPGSYTYTPLTFGGLAKWVVGWPIYPADAPLWFVRDLLLLILLVPLLSLVPRRLQIAGLGALFIYWLLGPVDLVTGGIPRAASAFFFLAGAWMGMNQVSLRAGPLTNRILIAAAAVFLLSAAAGATCRTIGGDYLAAQGVCNRLVRVSGALLVVCAGTRASIPAWLSGPLHRLSSAAFFLYAFHYCVFVCITGVFAKSSLGRLGVGGEVIAFGLVFATIIAISLVCYFLLRNYAPSLLSLLDGNRTARGPAGQVADPRVEVAPLPIHARRATLFE